MNVRIIRRFTYLMAFLVVGAVLFQTGYDYVQNQEPGDFETRQGDQRLSEGSYDEALERFNDALVESPNHRGALMGRALVFIATERYDEALAELEYLVSYLNETLEEDDLTGEGALAAAYANIGILYDRQGLYEQALEYYIYALRTGAEEDVLEGPTIFNQVLHGYRPSTVRDRAIYIQQQLQLPEEDRVLSIPELDEVQRMHKP